MNDEPSRIPSKDDPPFARQVGTKASRMLKARRHSPAVIWFGLGMMGLIGWSVVVPTLFGAALGLWLDKQFPGQHSWTLALLVAGLVLGCANAWRWVATKKRPSGTNRRTTMMNENLILVLAWLEGGVLGTIFFGGLWWTVRRGVSSPRPALLFLGSLLLRMGITLSGFYFVAGGHWERLLLCLLGFVMARLVVTRLLRPSVDNSVHHAKEAGHAS